MNRNRSKKSRKFSDIKEFKSLGKSFLRCFDESFEEYVSKTLNTTISGDSTIYGRLYTFLTFLASKNSQSTISLIRKLNRVGHAEVAHLDWQFALDAYREHVIKTYGKGTNAHNYLSILSSFLKHSASNGIWPHGLRIKGLKLPPRLARSMVTNNRARSKEGIPEVESVINELGLDCDNNQIRSMLSSVMSATGVKIKSTDDLIRATCVFLNDNLKLIRINAEKRLRTIIAKHLLAIRSANKKQNIEIAAKIHELLLYREELVSSGVGSKLKFQEIILLIESYGIDGLSAYIYHYQEGVVPRDSFEKKEPRRYHNRILYSYLSRRCRVMGGNLIIDINNHFNLHSEAQILAQCILYIDTSNNESSIRYLNSDCLVENEGVYHLIDNKNRANMSKRRIGLTKADPNEERIDVLVFEGCERLRLGVPKVIRYLQSATSRYRNMAKDHNKNRLFLTLYKNQNRNNSGYFPAPLSAGASTKSFAKVISELTHGAVQVPPSMIRQSSMQLTALLTKDPLKVMKQGRHTNMSSTSAYLKHLALNFNNELDIRKFQNSLEALVTMQIDEFIDFAGIDRSDYLASVEGAKKILNSQFGGVYCTDPIDGPYTKKGQACNKVEFCPTCTNRRPVLVASKHSILNTLLWNAALEYAFDQLSEAEMKKWQLWKVFNNYAIDAYRRNQDVRFELSGAETLFNLQKDENPYLKVFNL
ncbi:hypothetical protein [Shewanella sp. TB4-MNA-CIBAN-0142]|uniref:hypothetical protein n=1 Tax=Shewanella sp. TB4-MNA-CIBAN-0142 TaxID=3140464 RepID=UPI003318A021